MIPIIPSVGAPLVVDEVPPPLMSPVYNCGYNMGEGTTEPARKADEELVRFVF